VYKLQFFLHLYWG